MPRITIQQFRDRLAGRAEQDISAQAYREIARRPDLTREMGPRDWSPWPQLAAPRTAA
jgi:hypothetical protein